MARLKALPPVLIVAEPDVVKPSENPGDSVKLFIVERLKPPVWVHGLAVPELFQFPAAPTRS